MINIGPGITRAKGLVLNFRPVTLLGVAVEYKNLLIGVGVNPLRLLGRRRRELFGQQERVHGLRGINWILKPCRYRPGHRRDHRRGGFDIGFSGGRIGGRWAVVSGTVGVSDSRRPSPAGEYTSAGTETVPFP